MLTVLGLFRNLFGPWVEPAPARSKPHRTLLGLEKLEDRLTPSGGGPNTDTLVWKPQGGSTDASVQNNWYDQTLARQGATLPSGSNPVLLDGSVANSPIQSLFPLDVKSLTVQGGYSNTVTIGFCGSVSDKINSRMTRGR
jgi:hypothetical protein